MSVPEMAEDPIGEEFQTSGHSEGGLNPLLDTENPWHLGKVF